jgi:hypothetical protein
MKWIASQEERERQAETKRGLIKMAKEDAAKAKRTKDQAEQQSLLRDAESRINESKNV